MSGRPDMAVVADLLAARMCDLAQELCGEPTERSRGAWRWGRRGSFAVETSGPKRGSWFDHEAGEGGDALALVARMRGVPMAEAWGWALGWLGQDIETRPARPAVRPAEAPREPPRTLDLARDLWAAGVAARGSLVDAYLAARKGLTVPGDAPLRFHPRAWRNADYGPPGPAMLALMTSPKAGEPCGVHVTYLRPDGAGKAEGDRQKVMLGRAGIIRLVPDADVALGLGLAEGIETALAVTQRAGWAPVWAAGSAGAIARFPVLPGIETLTVFADTGGAGIHAARECGERWAAAGREARLLAPPAGDWDDALPARGAAA